MNLDITVSYSAEPSTFSTEPVYTPRSGVGPNPKQITVREFKSFVAQAREVCLQDTGGMALPAVLLIGYNQENKPTVALIEIHSDNTYRVIWSMSPEDARTPLNVKRYDIKRNGRWVDVIIFSYITHHDGGRITTATPVKAVGNEMEYGYFGTDSVLSLDIGQMVSDVHPQLSDSYANAHYLNTDGVLVVGDPDREGRGALKIFTEVSVGVWDVATAITSDGPLAKYGSYITGSDHGAFLTMSECGNGFYFKVGEHLQITDVTNIFCRLFYRCPESGKYAMLITDDLTTVYIVHGGVFNYNLISINKHDVEQHYVGVIPTNAHQVEMILRETHLEESITVFKH